MQKPTRNYAFIDSQNLYLGIRRLDWKLDYKKFRIYLKEKYSVDKAYIFIGFVPGNKGLYINLIKQGFVPKYKPVTPNPDDGIKGNIDADLVLSAVTEINNYDKAVIVSGDGGFYSLVGYLDKLDKLEVVISPEAGNRSILLKRSSRRKIKYLSDVREKLEYKRKSAT